MEASFIEVPRYFSASAIKRRRIAALISSGRNARPPREIGAGFPISLLTHLLTRSGDRLAWPTATSPTIRDSSGAKNTAEGVRRSPSALGISSDLLAAGSYTAIAESVVPRSIPMAG